MTLIERQIHTLRSFGIDRIAVVVGFGADLVRRVCGPDVEYVENNIFDRTNSLYSLWLARDMLRDGFVVLNSDVLLHPQLLADLLTAQYEDALLISYRDPATELGDEEMKVRVRAGRVADISKTMDPEEADGENVGVVKFGAAGAKLLIEQMDALLAVGGLRFWAPRAFFEVARRRPLYAIGTRGLPWIEIDFPEDYRRAVEEVLPRIIALGGEPESFRAVTAATGGD